MSPCSASTEVSQSALLAEIDQLGTNLLTVTNGQVLNGQEAELPVTATPMIRRIAGVEQAAPTAILASARVYRSDRIPVYDTGGLAAPGGRTRHCSPCSAAPCGREHSLTPRKAGTQSPCSATRPPSRLGIAAFDGPPPRIFIGGPLVHRHAES